jgi:2-hydroxyacyl-CoA lyase 1
LQNADVVFLMGARFNWIFYFGQAPRYAKDMKIIQLDIAPEEIGHNKATEVALVSDGKAIVGQLNKALAGRQWFHPKDKPFTRCFRFRVSHSISSILAPRPDRRLFRARSMRPRNRGSVSTR